MQSIAQAGPVVGAIHPLPTCKLTARLYTANPTSTCNLMPLVAYLRVSTTRQQASGLGLEAQQEAVERFVAASDHPILETFTEIESGAVNQRPELAKALDLCRRKKATLLIARLDRLSRSLAFIAQLLEAGVDVRCCDMPEANRLLLQLLAVFAEHERQMIRDRTRAALAAAKARGIKLGANGAVLAAAHRAEALAHAVTLRGVIEEGQLAGARSVRALSAWLNDRGVPTRSGGRWHPTSVSRLLVRLEAPNLSAAHH